MPIFGSPREENKTPNKFSPPPPKKNHQVAKIAETIATLSKNALTTSAPPTSAERSGLRKATHQLADLAKSGEWRCFAFLSLREEGEKGQRQKKRNDAGSASDGEGKRSPAPSLQLLFLQPRPPSFLSRSFSLPLVLSSFPRKTTEDNVDAVVEGGAVRAVVPLLTMFKVDEGRGVSR